MKTLKRSEYIALITAAVCSGGFVIFATYVANGATQPFDQAVLTTIYSWSTPLWDAFFLLITSLGGIIGVTFIGGLLLVGLLRRHMYLRSVLLLSGVIGAVITNVVLKSIFERPRPEVWNQIVIENSFSFPSGHAMASSALAFCIIVIFWQTRYRVPATISAILYMFLVGFSRLYLGVHYPTDILAAWLASGAIVAIVYFVINWWTDRYIVKKGLAESYESTTPPEHR